MARALIIGGFLAVVFWIFSIVDCAVQPATRHRGVSKRAWLLIVVLLPVIGGILWFVIGRSRRGGSGGRRTLAPDDDPQFLQRIAEEERARISQEEADRRIRQLEEELARLESEDDGPDPRP